jgi:hypothetical protein
MLSRRELITAGVAGGLVSESGVAAAEQQIDRDAMRDVGKAISGVESAIRNLDAVSDGAVGSIRRLMETYLRSNGKFPDFMEVGISIFFAMYDWHVKHQQQLVVVRQTDGKYYMQYMFTMLILRHDYDPGYLGTPYDKG